jgi:hypothetical protein
MRQPKAEYQHLLDHRSEPEARAVLEDALLEQGRTIRGVMPVYGGDGGGGGGGGYGGGGGGGYGGGDGSGSGGGGGYGGGGGDGGYGGYGGDGGYGGYGGGGGDGSGGGGGGGYGGGGGGGDGGYGGYGGDGGDGGDGGGVIPKMEASHMIDGALQIISVPAGSYPYVLIGWAKRFGGDEYDIHGARIIKRFGNTAALSDLAENGPKKDTQLLMASVLPERINRIHVTRCIPCNPKAWKKECPRPKDWDFSEAK